MKLLKYILVLFIAKTLLLFLIDSDFNSVIIKSLAFQYLSLIIILFLVFYLVYKLNRKRW